LDVPPLWNVRVHDFPAPKIGDAYEPLLATTWWLIVSLFVHVTESPWLMFTVFGVNPARLIETVTVADDAGAASTRASVVAASNITLPICRTPLIKRVMGLFPLDDDSDAYVRLKVRKRFVLQSGCRGNA
jgi:hypothetical protein